MKTETDSSPVCGNLSMLHFMTFDSRGCGINAGTVYEGLKLPVWLGSLGTFLAFACYVAAGAISGFINNVIYGLTFIANWIVYGHSIGIGIAVGVLHANGWFASATSICFAYIAIVSAVISTPPVICAADWYRLGWLIVCVMVVPIMHQCGWPYRWFVLDIWIKSAWPTWHSFIYRQLPKRMVFLAMINDDW